MKPTLQWMLNAELGAVVYDSNFPWIKIKEDTWVAIGPQCLSNSNYTGGSKEGSGYVSTRNIHDLPRHNVIEVNYQGIIDKCYEIYNINPNRSSKYVLRLSLV